MASSLPLNADCFQAPDRENPHYQRAWAGIVNPRFRLLPAETRLFRFGHTVDRVSGNNIPSVVNHTSPWWISREDFQSFLQAAPASARRHFVLAPSEAKAEQQGSGFDSFGFNALVRARMAVAHRFGQADRVIEVELVQPLGCFEGKGKPIIEDPKTGELMPLIVEGFMTWFADPSVMQYYVPGLRSDPGTRSPVASAALRIRKDLPAHQFFVL